MKVLGWIAWIAGWVLVGFCIGSLIVWSLS